MPFIALQPGRKSKVPSKERKEREREREGKEEGRKEKYSVGLIFGLI